MDKMDFQRILKQIEEIRALFIFAQRVIPYLEELIKFIQETTPLMEEVNKSILDSSNKMPAAVAQLDKISATTEMATSDILDGIDRMLSRIENALTVIEDLSQKEQERIEFEKQMILKIAETIDGEEETREAQVEQALNEYYASQQKEGQLDQLRQDLLALQTDAYDIMNLLQVQDITTQQIMAANSLIESVQQKLTELILKFGNLEAKARQAEQRSRAFDPNATFEDRSDVQAMADSILDQSEDVETGAQDEELEVKVVDLNVEPPQETPQAEGENAPISDTPNQEDIDRLFQEMQQK